MSDENPKHAGAKKPGSHRDLIVWRKGMKLARAVYVLTGLFPPEEKFGLTSQMGRAAVSVPSNLAEGQARRGTREFIQFFSQAEGSLAELDTQSSLAADLGLISPLQFEHTLELIVEMRRMLNALPRKLESARR
jgi:four helix bundle protein